MLTLADKGGGGGVGLNPTISGWFAAKAAAVAVAVAGTHDRFFLLPLIFFDLFGIGTTFCTRREIQYLLFAGYFLAVFSCTIFAPSHIKN